MKKTLGKKQSIDNQEWIEAMEHIEELVAKEELDELVQNTIKDIQEVTAEKKVAYAWSAGKDSLVLGEICRQAGIMDCMLAVCDLEYPEFMSWVKEHRPENLEIVNTGQNLEWLKRHPEMLFPQDSKIAARWFSIVQHRAQAQYYKAQGLDIILLGRRRADGNYCGRGSNIYTDGKGVTRYSPLSGWSHEAVLAYIHYYDVPMPPIYDWPNGYLCGTHPWAARQHMRSEEQGWQEVYEIDRSINETASSIFPKAKEVK